LPNEVNPCEFAEIIYKANIILLIAERVYGRAPNISVQEFKGNFRYARRCGVGQLVRFGMKASITHIDSFDMKPEHHRLLFLIMRRTISRAGCPKRSLYHDSLLATDGGLVKTVLLTLHRSLKTFTDSLRESL
jgi:hypothetical protein